MKTLTLKFGKEKINGRDTFFSTITLLKNAVNNIDGQQGLGVEEMSRRLKLLSILENHDDFDIEEGEFRDWHLDMTRDVEFEDADFNKLKELFNGVKWMVVSKFIVELSEDFKK